MKINPLMLVELTKGLSQAPSHLVLTAAELPDGKMESMFSMYGDRRDVIGAIVHAMKSDEEFLSVVEDALSAFHTVLGKEEAVNANNLPLAFEEPELEQIKSFLKISHAAVIVALVQCPGGGCELHGKLVGPADFIVEGMAQAFKLDKALLHVSERAHMFYTQEFLLEESDND